MSDLKQKTIETFFEEYNIVDPDKKIKLLPIVTDVIYNYNMNIVKLEEEKDVYRQKQLLTGLDELEAQLKEIFEEEN